LSKPIRVGTRASQLALRQTHLIVDLLRAARPGLEFELVEITTHGDRFQDTPITGMGEQIDRGIFNTALEEAVQRGEVDFATCSFKDVESQLPAGVVATSVGRREDHRDVLVSKHEQPLHALPRGAILATSSPRRISQLRAFRPDFRFEPLRGNVTTRAGKDRERFDGVILAAAGLLRLDLSDRIAQFVPEDILLPAPAQAAMGCEFSAQRADIADLIAAIQDPPTEICVRLEKELLARLSGGCFAPVGILARIVHGRLHLRCRIVSLNGQDRVEDSVAGDLAAGPALVASLCDKLTAAGGQEIIRRTRESLQTRASG
jgi:hydroxymethylbilane synthase